MSDVYKRLADRLDQFPNGFPSADDGVELQLLRKIFSPEEAEMALNLRPVRETVPVILERMETPCPEIGTILGRMASKGQIGALNIDGRQFYHLIPFVVGILEFQVNRVDKELVALLGRYLPHLAPMLGGIPPSVMRVVPVNSRIEAEHQVLHYEDVRRIIENSQSFQVLDCVCRKTQGLNGNPCSHTLETCLHISRHEGAYDRHRLGRLISKSDAMALLQKTEEEGLFHQTYNVQSESILICNCCKCCCQPFQLKKQVGLPYMIESSNYIAVINQDRCEACGVCADERCPMEAVVKDNGQYAILKDRCFGCGLCTSACPVEAVSLVPRPDSQRRHPPADMEEWYEKKAKNRGIPFPKSS